MDCKNAPTLTDAHQQIRLGDIQAAAQKWTVAIEYYSRAIEYFQAVEKTLTDTSLIVIVQAQIVDCERTIHRSKHQNDQKLKAERQSKKNRTLSLHRLDSPNPSDKKITRRNTMDLENTNAAYGYDSLVGAIFPKKTIETTQVKASTPVMKKKTKGNLEKLEELKISNDAIRNELNNAYDENEKLRNKIRELQLKNENQTASSASTENHDDDNRTDLENTM